MDYFDIYIYIEVGGADFILMRQYQERLSSIRAWSQHSVKLHSFVKEARVKSGIYILSKIGCVKDANY